MNSWDIIKNKSYQTVESGSSTVVTKVKGIGYINNSLSRFSSSIIQNQGLFKVFDTSSNKIFSIQLIKKINFLIFLLEFRLCV